MCRQLPISSDAVLNLAHGAKNGLPALAWCKRAQALRSRKLQIDAHAICQETGLLASSTCTPVNRVFLKLPEDNFDTTDDTSYAPPTQTCPGHKPVTILDGLKDSQDSSGTTVIDPDSSETQNTERRAEEDGDTPVTIPGDGDGDVSLGLP